MVHAVPATGLPGPTVRPVPDLPGTHAVSGTLWTVAGVTGVLAAGVFPGALPSVVRLLLPLVTFGVLWGALGSRTRGFAGRSARRGFPLAVAVVGLLTVLGSGARYGTLSLLAAGVLTLGLRRQDVLLLTAAVAQWATAVLVSSVPRWGDYDLPGTSVVIWPRTVLTLLVAVLVALAVAAYRREVLAVYAVAPGSPSG